MDINLIISKLRNPYGLSDDEKKAVRLRAASLLDQLQDAYINMRDWCEKRGWKMETFFTTFNALMEHMKIKHPDSEWFGDSCYSDGEKIVQKCQICGEILIITRD